MYSVTHIDKSRVINYIQVFLDSIKTREIETSSIIQSVSLNMEGQNTSIDLGNSRFIKVCEWKGDKRADLREYDVNIPTKKGISLPLMRWKCFLDNSDKCR